MEQLLLRSPLVETWFRDGRLGRPRGPPTSCEFSGPSANRSPGTPCPLSPRLVLGVNLEKGEDSSVDVTSHSRRLATDLVSVALSGLLPPRRQVKVDPEGRRHRVRVLFVGGSSSTTDLVLVSRGEGCHEVNDAEGGSGPIVSVDVGSPHCFHFTPPRGDEGQGPNRFRRFP